MVLKTANPITTRELDPHLATACLAEHEERSHLTVQAGTPAEMGMGHKERARVTATQQGCGITQGVYDIFGNLPFYMVD